MAACPKISRGGGIFEKFSARGVYQKYPPYPLFPLPAICDMSTTSLTLGLLDLFALLLDKIQIFSKYNQFVLIFSSNLR